MVDFSYGILTVSDRCFRGEAIDESGPKLEILLRQHYNAVKILKETVPDEEKVIIQKLLQYTDQEKLNCIITTGGSGCSPRDVTPEATRKVIQREFSQLTMVMLLEGLKKTEFAALTRGVCGIRNQSLIINMPGSVKACSECFGAIKRILPHAIELLCDMRDSTEKTHAIIQSSSHVMYQDIKEKLSLSSTGRNDEHYLTTPPIKEIVLESLSADSVHSTSDHPTKEPEEEQDTSSESHFSLASSLEASNLQSVIQEVPTIKNHVCPHKTANPGDKSDRNSPYPMIDIEEALQKILNSTTRISKSKTFKSPMNCPPFRASIKDGYAVKSSSRSKLKSVISSISAGDSIVRNDFKDDECYKINTGAAVPLHADAVVQVEDTILKKSYGNGRESLIELKVLPAKNQDIREIGCDLKENEVLFTTDGMMDVAQKTILASVGLHTTEFKPRIAIISTGDELRAPDSGELDEGQIYDSNTTMLKLLCEKYNFDVSFTQIAKDSYESLKSAIENAMSKCQVVISSGGVSMGDKDFVKKLLIDMGYVIHFGRVNVKPGKPMTYATLAEKCSFFALPGNPVSAFVTFHIFVLPALRKMCGFPDGKCHLPQINVTLQGVNYELDERPEFVRATLKLNSKRGIFNAYVTNNQMSSRIASLIHADALLQFPARSESKEPMLKPGAQLKATVIDQFFLTSFNDNL